MIEGPNEATGIVAVHLSCQLENSNFGASPRRGRHGIGHYSTTKTWKYTEKPARRSRSALGRFHEPDVSCIATLTHGGIMVSALRAIHKRWLQTTHR
jgi:hypothetical protein